MSHLDATLRGAIYRRSTNALTWKKSGHAIMFHALPIATSSVEHCEGVVAEIDGLLGPANLTWDDGKGNY